ncbi:FxsB family cyclophane-forming radical SAM/SPASM peptide maturase [Umezawaea tangerina]|uniref:FxsB family cyclophane-forming radical SAM/SPASM peptide maturase n=1 Tax=Umezawaea tangerina TaxID=84725 RepID=UPI001FE29CF9|nr:FxsB family cyclophane-forming radical SAM/SPASM peptide maturase [Umezawaea tangerina]
MRAPLSLRQFILKVHGRCNLACDYCYVYTMADQRWRTRPRAMSRVVVDSAARRIADHVRAHGIPSVELVLHGGEPLLAGPEMISYCVGAVRGAVGDDAVVQVSLQTNGTLLDRPFLALLHDLGVRVSLSLDGGREAHDRHRRGHDGRGTYDRIAARLEELEGDEFRAVFAGFLCTVDIRNDPIDVYESLVGFRPPAVDFLLPHGNWLEPPPGRDRGAVETPYAEWLIAIFDRWYGAPVRETGVRVFDEMINVALGGRSGVEGVGLSPARMIVVETDGSIEDSDMLASTFEGAAATGLHVHRDPFDAALRLPAVAERQLGAAGLPSECRGCPVRRVCGGGLPVHRYDRDGFDHPSVYCKDLFALVGHVRTRLVTDLTRLRRSS